MRIPLDLPPGLNSDDTVLSAQGRWGDCNNMRFREGRAQVIGGWESLMTTLLSGVCRAVLSWTDNSGVLNIAFGSSSKLQTWYGGSLYDITPFGAPNRLAADPLSVTNASATVTVSEPAHGRSTGDSLKVFGTAAVGGITPVGTFVITKIDADHYSFVFGSNATSTATGGGSNVVVTPQTALPAGATDGTGTSGYGTGPYGTGPYGQTPPTADYFPRTWSLQPWGQQLLASPRGGGLYLWGNDTSQRAVAVDNAPTKATCMLVVPTQNAYQCFLFGTQEEASGNFNPMCIRTSSIRDLSTWSTLASGSTAREYTLTGGGRIVGAKMCGPYILCWTNHSLFVGSYVGALNQPWRFDEVGKHCGLIGPNAAVVVGQSAYWVSADNQFFTYSLGGVPSTLPCDIRKDFADNIAATQGDKVVASSNAAFSEIRFDYPDARDGYENSRYVALGLSDKDAGAWYRGQMARSAFVDSGPQPYPIGVAPDGHAYYHEKGNSADGGKISWFIRSAGMLLDVTYRLLLLGMWPDFRNQVGPVTVTAYERETPDGEASSVSADPLAPGDVKADFLISGRIFELEYSGNSAPAGCRLGTPVLDATRAGKL